MFKAVMKHVITLGKLAIVLPNGAVVRLGELAGNQDEPEIVIHL
jgi:hypothetical protein